MNATDFLNYTCHDSSCIFNWYEIINPNVPSSFHLDIVLEKISSTSNLNAETNYLCKRIQYVALLLSKDSVDKVINSYFPCSNE